MSRRVREIEFFIDTLLIRIHFIIEMIRWTGLAPSEFEFRFPGSLISTFLRAGFATYPGAGYVLDINAANSNPKHLNPKALSRRVRDIPRRWIRS